VQFIVMSNVVAAILLGNGVSGRMAIAPHYKLVAAVGWTETILLLEERSINSVLEEMKLKCA